MEDVELLLPLEGVADGACALPPLAAAGADLAGVAGTVAGSGKLIITKFYYIVFLLHDNPSFWKLCLKHTVFRGRVYLDHRK